MATALRVKKEMGQGMKQALLHSGLLDRDSRISRSGKEIDIPIIRGFDEDARKTLAAAGFGPDDYDVVTLDPVSRGPPRDPMERIRYLLEEGGLFDEKIKGALPKKWEKLGDVLVLKTNVALRQFNPREQEKIYETYAEVLGCRSVVEDVSGIAGVRREPGSRLLWGDEVTETTHVENGIRYRLDPLKVMFSSGNVDERIRYGGFDCADEVVVDMFAGIGYFTLPLAVYGKPKRLYACEINPNAYHYLCENVKLNRVEQIVTPLLGDNRKTAPEGVADRISMGYVGTTHLFLEKAMRILKPEGGIIHYHETCPNELLRTQPIDRVRDAAAAAGFSVKKLNFKNIKSYSPGVSHVVLDVRIF